MINLRQFCFDLKNPQSNLTTTTRNIIREIYSFYNTPSCHTKEMLEKWKQDFKYIYGDVETNISSNSKLKKEALFSTYEISTIENSSDSESIQYLFFAIQTFFTLMIKVIMKSILIGELPISDEEIILGTFAERKKINNYCNPDVFCWPLYELQNGFKPVFEKIKIVIGEYFYEQTIEDFVEHNNNDYVKQIYEATIPKELRHALGEYYTPDWLAEITLKDSLSYLEFTNIKEIKVLDPTCGSGTFLLQTIKKKRKNGTSLNEIVSSVFGIDINPLAVLTAKTNYILSILDLIYAESKVISIPIYNADVLTDSVAPRGNMLNTSTFNIENPIESICSYASRDCFFANQIKQMDLIIGNPPWVNWEYLPEEYKNKSQHLWVDYGLFNAKGLNLSFSKEDISVLITYVVIDKFLKDKGILAFVIRQGVFKSAQNGIGFRKFKIKNDTPVKVLKVSDLSRIKAFDNATTSTSIFFASKGLSTEYPVPYYVWDKRKDLRHITFNSYSNCDEVLSQIEIHSTKASPAKPDDLTSLWMNVEEEKLSIIKQVMGENDYKARTGVFTGGANAVYWLQIKEAKDDSLLVSNIVEKAKRKVTNVTEKIEKEFVYPMLKGSDISKWHTSYSQYLLVPHTIDTKMWPVSQEIMRKNFPKTFSYLSFFKKELDERNGFAGWEKNIQKKEFHSILRIGEYTFAPYKVVWKYIAQEFICAVVSSVDDQFLGKKLIIPNEKVMYISTDSEEEAYYLCGILSSTPISEYVKSFMNPTSISAHVLNKLRIFNFDSNNDMHVKISNICKHGHFDGEYESHIKEIDKLVAILYEEPKPRTRQLSLFD